MAATATGGQALGDVALQFHRADLAAILFFLTALPDHPVAIKITLHLPDHAVKDVVRGPEQRFEIRFPATCRSAWLIGHGDGSLVLSVRCQLGALAAGSATSKVGHAGDQSGPGLGRAVGIGAVLTIRIETSE